MTYSLMVNGDLLRAWLEARIKEEHAKGDEWAREDLMAETAGQCFARAEAYEKVLAYLYPRLDFPPR